MSTTGFDPKVLVLRKDIHPVELWSPGVKVRIHVPAVPLLGTVIAAGVGALAGGAVAAVVAFQLPIGDALRWGAVLAAAVAGALWAGRKFREMFEEHDVTLDWTAGRATFRHGSSTRSIPLDAIRGLILQGLKTRHEPGQVDSTAASYTAYWCRLEAELAEGRALILEGDPERDPHSARAALDAMGADLAHALGVSWRFEDFREMTAREYFL